jgi:hypothetical protein
MQSESRTGNASITVTALYDGHARLISLARTGEDTQANVYNGMDQRVVVTSGTVTRRFVYDPDGRVLGEYGTSASDVIAERIWMTPEVVLNTQAHAQRATRLSSEASHIEHTACLRLIKRKPRSIRMRLLMLDISHLVGCGSRI